MISLEYYVDKIKEISNLALPDRFIDPENEPVFNVDLNTREISVPSALRQIGVVGDHNAETLWFAFDRYFDGEDLMTKAVGIQFRDALGNVAMRQADYRQDTSDSTDKKVVLIGWKVPFDVTHTSGQVTLSLRFYTLTDTDCIYSLGTENAQVYIGDSLYITDEDENLNPPRDSLSQLVSRIEELYINNTLQTVDYATAANKPQINDVTMVGKLYTNEEKAKKATALVDDNYKNHWIEVSYADLTNPPSINGVPLVGNKTDSDLGIRVEVDPSLSTSSVNPIQNQAVTQAINSITTDMAPMKTNIETLLVNVENLWEELDGMTYIPLSINEFYHTFGLAEVGSSVNELTFEWKLSALPLNLSINDIPVDDVSAITTTLTDLNLSDNTVFTLKAVDKRSTASAETELVFTYNVFKGVAEATDSYTSAFLEQLTGELQTSRETIMNVTAGSNQYIYYAVPKSYGDCIFTSGGFTGGFTKVATISHMNIYGVAADYDIWKSDYAGLGLTSVIVS
jgi:hypothetical protein